MTEAILKIATADEVLGLFGPRDQNLRLLRQHFDVAITQRRGRIRIAGPTSAVQQATRVLERLRHLFAQRWCDFAQRCSGGRDGGKDTGIPNAASIQW